MDRRELNLVYWNRIHNMCEGTSVHPTECVQVSGRTSLKAHPRFTLSPERYILAVDIVENKPVFPGDALYDTRKEKAFKVELFLPPSTILIKYEDYTEGVSWLGSHITWKMPEEGVKLEGTTLNLMDAVFLTDPALIDGISAEEEWYVFYMDKKGAGIISKKGECVLTIPKKDIGISISRKPIKQKTDTPEVGDAMMRVIVAEEEGYIVPKIKVNIITETKVKSISFDIATMEYLITTEGNEKFLLYGNRFRITKEGFVDHSVRLYTKGKMGLV